MTQDRPAQVVSIGGWSFDPLALQTEQLADKDDEPVDPDRPLACLVQFAAALTPGDIDDLRDTFGLRLTDYLPPGGYVERLSTRAMDPLRADGRCRAVVHLRRDLKVAARLKGLDAKDDEPAPAHGVDVVLFPGANAAAVAEVAAAGQEALVLDDRAAGGALVVRFRAPDRFLAASVARLEQVRWVEAVPETVDDGARGPGRRGGAGAAARPRDLPLHGEGQVIGILDKGPPDLEHCFFKDVASGSPGPTHRKVIAVRNAVAGPVGDHATFTAAYAAGDQLDRPGAAPRRGLAWAAKLVCGNRVDLGSTSLFSELTAAAASGACIHSNSWHSKPQGSGLPATYDPRSADVDAFTWANEDHVVVGSSGNSGEEQGPPGSAKNALCVSAASPMGSDRAVGDGNAGPTADGRRKPDVTGVGCGVHSAIAGTGCKTGTKSPCASSYATPWVAAAVALVRQHFVQGFHPTGLAQEADRISPSSALLRAAVIGAAGVSARSRLPNDAEGWGEVDLDSLLAMPTATLRLLWDVRNAAGLSTGQTRARHVDLVDDGPLGVTLVWTEPPGAVGSDVASVNDLDLRVTSPDGLVFMGNQLVEGESVPGEISDRVNNVERVVVAHPSPGRWRVEVRATEVNVGAPGQGFAVVLTGTPGRSDDWKTLS